MTKPLWHLMIHPCSLHSLQHHQMRNCPAKQYLLHPQRILSSCYHYSNMYIFATKNHSGKCQRNIEASVRWWENNIYICCYIMSRSQKQQLLPKESHIVHKFKDHVDLIIQTVCSAFQYRIKKIPELTNSIIENRYMLA